MKIIDGIKYTKEHEWVKIEGNEAKIGITDFAQHNLGDIVFVELPKVGADFKAGDSIGVVESVKSVSDIFSPIHGTVFKVNEALSEKPEKLNEDPYGSWIAVLKVKEIKEDSGLMDSAAYAAFCETEG